MKKTTNNNFIKFFILLLFGVFSFSSPANAFVGNLISPTNWNSTGITFSTTSSLNVYFSNNNVCTKIDIQGLGQAPYNNLFIGQASPYSFFDENYTLTNGFHTIYLMDGSCAYQNVGSDYEYFIYYVENGAITSVNSAIANAHEFNDYTVASDGRTTVNDVNLCNYFTPYIMGFENYKGQFPDTSTKISTTTNAFICGLLDDTFYTNYFENGWGNGTLTTDDGDYWVRFGTVGVQYVSTDYTQEYYYMRATRLNGVWSKTGGTPPPPATPSCSDNIQNQNETGVDVGGICFYVSLNWPENSTTVPDFAQWTTTYYGNDASPTSPTLQQGVMWAENSTLLESCLNYPTSPADFTACMGGTDRIFIDYGDRMWSSMSSTRQDITKIGTMTAGKRYYARAVLYDIDDATLLRVNLLSYGDIISFTIDNTTGTGGDAGKCIGIDFGCIMQSVFRWAFVPSASSLSQFSDFKTLLEQKAPFGYAKQIYEVLTTITYNANDNIIVLQKVTPITTYIFTPLKNGFAWLLWFAFMFMLFKRFKDIQV